MNDYWSRTDDMIRENGGRSPICPSCGGEMYAVDDHGRFACGCRGGNEAAMEQELGLRLEYPSVWDAIEKRRKTSRTVEDKTNS